MSDTGNIDAQLDAQTKETERSIDLEMKRVELARKQWELERLKLMAVKPLHFDAPNNQLHVNDATSVAIAAGAIVGGLALGVVVGATMLKYLQK